MSYEAFDNYIAKWREADPQRSSVWLFLRRDERGRFGVVAAMQEEWRKTARAGSEPQVAAAKLGWWRDELGRATRGEAHHPLAIALSDDPCLRRIPTALWVAPIDRLLLGLGAPTPPDFPAQRAAAQPLAMALAELDCRVWFDRPGNARAAAVIAGAGLVDAVCALPETSDDARSPLPMNLLARHGLTVAALSEDTPPRRAALRDYVVILAQELARAATMHGDLTLLHAVRLQHCLHVLERAQSVEDPLAALRAPDAGFRNLLQTWRAARTWRAMPPAGTEA